jgi:hypothetical protein
MEKREKVLWIIIIVLAVSIIFSIYLFISFMEDSRDIQKQGAVNDLRMVLSFDECNCHDIIEKKIQESNIYTSPVIMFYKGTLAEIHYKNKLETGRLFSLSIIPGDNFPEDAINIVLPEDQFLGVNESSSFNVEFYLKDGLEMEDLKRDAIKFKVIIRNKSTDEDYLTSSFKMVVMSNFKLPFDNIFQ